MFKRSVKAKLVFGIAMVFFFWTFPLYSQPNSLPEFTVSLPDAWINSAPLNKSDLKGKIVLIEIWTSI